MGPIKPSEGPWRGTNIINCRALNNKLFDPSTDGPLTRPHFFCFWATLDTGPRMIFRDFRLYGSLARRRAKGHRGRGVQRPRATWIRHTEARIKELAGQRGQGAMRPRGKVATRTGRSGREAKEKPRSVSDAGLVPDVACLAFIRYHA